MAYAIFDQVNGSLKKIASDDSHRDYIIEAHPGALAINISDAEFQKIRKGLSDVTANVETDALTWDDKFSEGTTADEMGYIDAAGLTNDIAATITAIDASVSAYPNNGMVSILNSYKSTLQGLDHSGVSYPTTGVFATTLDGLGVNPAYTALQIP
jgi:hypothetical protein